MLKAKLTQTITQTFVPMVIVLALAACSSSGSGTPGSGTPGSGSGATGGSAATGGHNAGAGTAGATGSGGVGGSSQAGNGGAATATGGTGGGSTMTLQQACTKNCSLAAGLSGCSTTMDVCVQSCLTTRDNTAMVNPVLGTKYEKMMICIATESKVRVGSRLRVREADASLEQVVPRAGFALRDAHL